jgi:hypothetical protein
MPDNTGNLDLDRRLVRQQQDLEPLTLGYLVVFPSFPTASKEHRGRVAVKFNAAGTADEVRICRKKADDTYEWLDMLATVPAAKVYHNANQTINNNAATALAFNSERFDTDTIHDPAANTRLTCKTAGRYLITAMCRFAENATGIRELSIRLNGGTFIADDVRMATSGNVTALMVSCVWDMAVNDYVEAIAYQNSTVGLDVVFGNAYSPEFSMVRVG